MEAPLSELNSERHIHVQYMIVIHFMVDRRHTVLVHMGGRSLGLSNITGYSGVSTRLFERARTNPCANLSFYTRSASDTVFFCQVSRIQPLSLAPSAV